MRKAAELDPYNEELLFKLGELYKSQDKLKEANTYFKKLLFINPNHEIATEFAAE